MLELLEFREARLIVADEHGFLAYMLLLLIILLHEIPAAAAALDFELFHAHFPFGIRI
jgi:hypothetical protein